ncbi:MAG: hypothetical protein ACJ0QW_02840 [Porticoccaceae bacterium]
MKTFNKTLIAATTIATFGLAAAPSALAVDASASIATSYLFRGAEMNSGSAVVSADVSSSMAGVTYGVWVSSGDSQTEYDLYADYSGSVGDIGYSVGYVDYNYADDPDTAVDETIGLDFEETYVGLSYGPLSATLYNNTANDSDYMAVSYSAGAFTVTYGDTSDSGDAVAEVVAVADDPATAGVDETVAGVAGVDASIGEATHFDVSYAVNDSLTFTVSKPEDEDAIVVASYSLSF